MYKTKLCGNEGKQAPGNGNSNLLSYLSANSADYEDEFACFQRMTSSSMESFGFVSEKTNHLSGCVGHRKKPFSV